MVEPKHMVIVGGGTAGWIAAYVLKDAARRRGVPVRLTVIESSKIPTVGVGESTTAVFRAFLQQSGIDEFEFLRETEATVKLGIRHDNWRRPGFTYYGPIDDPHLVVQAPAGAPSDYLNVYSVAAGRRVQDMHLFGPLMERRKSPYARRPDGSLIPLGPFHYGFQFDQAKVGRFLRERATGIALVDAVVEGVERNSETGDIDKLVLDSGERLAADFFVDATGFRKRLIGQELGAGWLPYGKELPVNRAITFWFDHTPGEELANYTRATAASAGWMWQIPTQHRTGNGYVFSDEFLTPEAAKLEVEQMLGRPVDVRGDIRFSIGRLDRCWIGNCLAVGLAASFLEPLESTSIHGTIVQLMLFAGYIFKSGPQATAADRETFNARIGRQVDDFRTFINTHYVSEREDTPFWRDVKASRIHPETRQRLEHWRRAMPRHEDFASYLDGLPHVESQLHYPVLDGLGLLDPAIAKAEMARDPKLRAFARKTVDSLTKEYKQAATKALGHAEFLEIVREMG